MKFQEMVSAGGVPVDSYDDEGVEIAQVRHAFPLLLADKAVALDKASWQDFSAGDVQRRNCACVRRNWASVWNV